VTPGVRRSVVKLQAEKDCGDSVKRLCLCFMKMMSALKKRRRKRKREEEEEDRKERQEKEEKRGKRDGKRSRREKDIETYRKRGVYMYKEI
jgi:chromatin remodeling complex protein RSC6